MGGASKERVWGGAIAAAEEKARETRHVADAAACNAWNIRMEGYGGPAQPSPPIGDALNAGFRFLEVKCQGCSLHSTVLTTLRRPGETPIWQLEQRMRCRSCSEMRGYSFHRSPRSKKERRQVDVIRNYCAATGEEGFLNRTQETRSENPSFGLDRKGRLITNPLRR